MKSIFALIAISLTFVGCASTPTPAPTNEVASKTCRWVPNYVRTQRDDTMCNDKSVAMVGKNWEDLRPSMVSGLKPPMPAK